MKIKIELIKSIATAGKFDCLAFPVTADKSAKKGAAGLKRFNAETRKDLAALDRGLGESISAAVDHYGFKAAARCTLDVPLAAKKGPNHLRLFALPEKAATEDWRRFAADAVAAAKRSNAETLLISLSQLSPANLERALEAALEGVHLAGYEFNLYKEKPAATKLKKIAIALPADAKKTSADISQTAAITAEAVSFARDLVNTGPSDHTPADFVRLAKKLSAKHRRLRLQVLNEARLKQLKANALLAVARGSDQKPYLLHLKLAGKSKRAKKVLLVGKGITFDSGGLSIKTGKGMEEMKCDMAGAAAVLATMSALAQLPKFTAGHEIHALIPTCENMINGRSVKPGDVVRAMSGKTIEILNTDAEGRLILADALTYGARFKPDVVIDLATLTGACVVALGSDYAGMFCDDDKLSAALKTAGQEAGENLWPLPLAAEYRRELNSPIADLKNIGSGGPGAITAALFLKEFTPQNALWAHLDIAGPAFVGKANEYTPAGGTGFGVRTLLRFVREVSAIF